LQSCNVSRFDGKFYVRDHSSNAIPSCYKVFAAIYTSSERSKPYLEVHFAQIGFRNYITFRNNILTGYSKLVVIVTKRHSTWNVLLHEKILGGDYNFFHQLIIWPFYSCSDPHSIYRAFYQATSQYF